ncbi:hypothetical protein AB6A40_004856 [Gnathostoma spinigerum]|uniref:Uncharacterized protein n=1 Tax=Gnathostoma spinigerum TaxID=75299 RepID=A0ABD6EFY2_9BILA
MSGSLPEPADPQPSVVGQQITQEDGEEVPERISVYKPELDAKAKTPISDYRLKGPEAKRKRMESVRNMALNSTSGFDQHRKNRREHTDPCFTRHYAEAQFLRLPLIRCPPYPTRFAPRTLNVYSSEPCFYPVPYQHEMFRPLFSSYRVANPLMFANPNCMGSIRTLHPIPPNDPRTFHECAGACSFPNSPKWCSPCSAVRPPESNATSSQEQGAIKRSGKKHAFSNSTEISESSSAKRVKSDKKRASTKDLEETNESIVLGEGSKKKMKKKWTAEEKECIEQDEMNHINKKLKRLYGKLRASDEAIVELLRDLEGSELLKTSGILEKLKSYRSKNIHNKPSFVERFYTLACKPRATLMLRKIKQEVKRSDDIVLELRGIQKMTDRKLSKESTGCREEGDASIPSSDNLRKTTGKTFVNDCRSSLAETSYVPCSSRIPSFSASAADKAKYWDRVAMKGKALFLKNRSQKMMLDRLSKYHLVDPVATTSCTVVSNISSRSKTARKGKSKTVSEQEEKQSLLLDRETETEQRPVCTSSVASEARANSSSNANGMCAPKDERKNNIGSFATSSVHSEFTGNSFDQESVSEMMESSSKSSPHNSTISLFSGESRLKRVVSEIEHAVGSYVANNGGSCNVDKFSSSSLVPVNNESEKSVPVVLNMQIKKEVVDGSECDAASSHSSIPTTNKMEQMWNLVNREHSLIAEVSEVEGEIKRLTDLLNSANVRHNNLRQELLMISRKKNSLLDGGTDANVSCD